MTHQKITEVARAMYEEAQNRRQLKYSPRGSQSTFPRDNYCRQVTEACNA